MTEQQPEQVIILRPYCLKCKSKQEVVESTIDTTNGRNRLKGKCQVCSTFVSCFLKGEDKTPEQLKEQDDKRKARQLQQREEKKKDQIRKKELKEKKKKMKDTLEKILSDDEDSDSRKKKLKRKAKKSKTEKPKKKTRKEKVVEVIHEEPEDQEAESEDEDTEVDNSKEADEEQEAIKQIFQDILAAPPTPEPVVNKKKLTLKVKRI